MAIENLNIIFGSGGQSLSTADIISLDIELGGNMASMVYLTLATRKEPGTDWLYLDEERFSLFQPVTIELGFDGTGELLFSGYVTNTRPNIDTDIGNCSFEIWAMDATVRMDRQEKIKVWPGKKDSEIALEIFSDYSLTALPGQTIEDTTVIHDETISTIVQRESDIRFLRRLALRNGFECYVDGETPYFRPPQVDVSLSQPVLAAHFGVETNLLSFTANVEAASQASVSGVQVDRLNKELVEVNVESTELTVLGDKDHAALRPSDIDAGSVVISMNSTTGQPELEALCRGIYQEADWFVKAEGVVAARDYGHVLKPYLPVTVKGVGERLSGVYYVTQVTHSFSNGHYNQRFVAKRNALMPNGTENFELSSSDVLGIL